MELFALKANSFAIFTFNFSVLLWMIRSLRTVNVTRYVTPLREGGSLPAIAEADDEFLYVLKFRGAGQGVKSLIAELIGGEIARTLGLKVPEMVFAHLDTAFGRTEPDEEIQDLLKASVGLNLALHYLSGAITFDPAVTSIRSYPGFADRMAGLPAYQCRPHRPKHQHAGVEQGTVADRSRRIALYFHHSWENWEEHAQRPFMQVKDHVLLPWASEMEEADADIPANTHQRKDQLHRVVDP